MKFVIILKLKSDSKIGRHVSIKGKQKQNQIKQKTLIWSFVCVRLQMIMIRINVTGFWHLSLNSCFPIIGFDILISNQNGRLVRPVWNLCVHSGQITERLRKRKEIIYGAKGVVMIPVIKHLQTIDGARITRSTARQDLDCFMWIGRQIILVLSSPTKTTRTCNLSLRTAVRFNSQLWHGKINQYIFYKK